MKTIKVFPILLITLSFLSCEDQLMLEEPGIYHSDYLKANRSKVLKATGSVEILWKGADKGSGMGNKPEILLPFFEFEALMDDGFHAARGTLVYRVLTADSLPHRLIQADVMDVYIDPLQDKAWIIGKVISDSKGCEGNGSDGHQPGCNSDEGGCSHDDGTHDDGGCSHDDGTHDDGGCSHDDGTTDDGGCSHDDGTQDGETTGDGTFDDGSHDEGCSHDDTDHSDEGGCGASGTDGAGGPIPPGSDVKGNPVSGKNCRFGQIIAVKMHDGGTPGAKGDGITWKWFLPDGAFVPSIENLALWPHLCKKTIIEGNLVIHE